MYKSHPIKQKFRFFAATCAKDTKELAVTQAQYPGGISFSDLQKGNSGNALKEIKTQGQSKPTFVYFNPQQIKGYDAIDKNDATAFVREMTYPSYCAPTGKNGIKYLAGKNERPTCQVNINGKLHNFEITHELKIPGANRIAFFTLSSTNSGATILVASNYVDGGFHDSKSKNKIYQMTLNVGEAAGAKSVATLTC